MEGIRLVEITLADKDNLAVFNMLQSIDKEENGFGNEAYGLSFRAYQEYIEERVKDKDESTVRPGFAPQTIYWLYDNDQVVGFSKMRHHLIDAYRKDCGHVGFAIGKDYRNRGYGKTILRLIIFELKKIGVTDVLIVCQSMNKASRKIIEHNKGVLEKEEGGKCFYWIRA